MKRLKTFWRNLQNSIQCKRAKSDCCARCGRWLHNAKTKPSGDAEMPRMHMRGACQRIERYKAVAAQERAEVEGTRIYMSRLNGA